MGWVVRMSARDERVAARDSKRGVVHHSEEPAGAVNTGSAPATAAYLTLFGLPLWVFSAGLAVCGLGVSIAALVMAL